MGERAVPKERGVLLCLLTPLGSTRPLRDEPKPPKRGIRWAFHAKAQRTHDCSRGQRIGSWYLLGTPADGAAWADKPESRSESGFL
jgi:hypothetical protein